MINNQKLQKVQERVLNIFEKACIVLTPEEKRNIEIADFGLGRLEEFGLQLIVYINTEQVCAKEMVFSLKIFYVTVVIVLNRYNFSSFTIFFYISLEIFRVGVFREQIEKFSGSSFNRFTKERNFVFLMPKIFWRYFLFFFF